MQALIDIASRSKRRASARLSRNRDGFATKTLAKAAAFVLKAVHNHDYDAETNGEYRLLQRLSIFPMKTMWDAGANVGDWTRAAKQYFPAATVFAFEIHPDTFKELSRRTRNLEGVIAINLGLSDTEGTAELHCYGNESALSSMFDYPHDLPGRTIPCKVVTGDGYSSANGIEHIDFLKLDVEGAEPQVMRGFAHTIETGRVDIIQFEYGLVNILSRFLLRDFYEYLVREGYTIGKLYPTYVDFREYRLTDEDFLGPNFIACRKEKSDYVAAMSRAR